MNSPPPASEPPSPPAGDAAPAPPPALGRGLWERLSAVLTLKPGAFRDIAAAPSTLQSLFVALLGIALAGSISTLFAMLTILYPLAVLAGITLHSAISRFLAQMFLASQLPAGGLPSYPDWIRAQYFAVVPGVFGVIPILGSLVGWIYSIVLEVRSIMDMTRCSAGQGIVIFLLACIVPAILLFGIIGLFGAGILGLFGAGMLGSLAVAPLVPSE